MCNICMNTGYVIVERFHSTSYSKKIKREVDQYVETLIGCRCSLGRFENKIDDSIYLTHSQLYNSNKFILNDIDLVKASPNYESLRLIH